MLNAAVPPIHAWLPDAYPEATVTGAVFMCAFTTKTAVYALCRGFPGMELLIWLGVIMSLYGVVYAAFGVRRGHLRAVLARWGEARRSLPPTRGDGNVPLLWG